MSKYTYSHARSHSHRESGSNYNSYWDCCKNMLRESASHLKRPSTLIVILVLVGVYLLLGIVGAVVFSFYSNDIVQYVTTNLDIIVNALLGFFFGPVTSAIGVTLCSIVRMIAVTPNSSLAYLLGAFLAGFIHGWVLYRNKISWFGTRFRGFYTDLLTKTIVTRLSVSIFVNILFMSVAYKLFASIPFSFFLTYYSKSGVSISTPVEFLKVFFICAFFEAAVIFIAISIANFIVTRVFPAWMAPPSLIVNKKGEITNLEDQFADDDPADEYAPY